ncbi:MAG: cytochrome c oxidase assembly protein [Alphaproteobacteria bacterium]|nr:cytochrome c oxidase assembly protein [Alphaproteobacteria bacterium]
MGDRLTTTKRRWRGATLLILLAVLAGMSGLTAASVPLYRIFCGATGFGGTTQRAQSAPSETSTALVKISFDAQTAPGLRWEFRPLTPAVSVHPGAQTEVFFRAVNHSATTVTARAVYNVTPAKIGIYFDKLQCFCFNNQTLEPGQKADMGVVFFVDPDMLKDPDTREVRAITLSYTMFPVANAPPQSAAASPAPLAAARSVN